MFPKIPDECMLLIQEPCYVTKISNVNENYTNSYIIQLLLAHSYIIQLLLAQLHHTQFDL
jgi:hypothetical protein